MARLADLMSAASRPGSRRSSSLDASDPSVPADAVAPTRWGDREGRRRDILSAARDQMATGGYLALNMRDLARGASVSLGTLYSYFATKEEIFATLYAEEIERHNERITPICDGADDLEELLRDLARAYLDLYGRYGRYFTTWSVLVAEGAERDSPLPDPLRAELRAATLRQAGLVRAALTRTAARRGIDLRDPELVLTFLWSTLNGIGDHLTSGRRRLTGVTGDELVAYAARTIALAITTP